MHDMAWADTDIQKGRSELNSVVITQFSLNLCVKLCLSANKRGFGTILSAKLHALSPF